MYKHNIGGCRKSDYNQGRPMLAPHLTIFRQKRDPATKHFLLLGTGARSLLAHIEFTLAHHSMHLRIIIILPLALL